LERRTPRLTIFVPNAADGRVQVRRDGIVLMAPSLGVALPVDPGHHRIEVGTPGAPPQTFEVVLGDGEAKTFRIDVPTGSDDRSAGDAREERAHPATRPLAPAQASIPPPSHAVRADASTGDTLLKASELGIGTAMLLSLGYGVAESLAAIARHGDAVAQCHGHCATSPDAQQLQREATIDASRATGGYVAGAVFGAAEIALLIGTTLGRSSHSVPVRSGGSPWRWALTIHGSSERFGASMLGQW
jgi:hypothetical protein